MVNVLLRVRDKARAMRGDSAPLPPSFTAPLRGARALEIGGPSPYFQADAIAAVYPVLGTIDGVQFSTDTVWHGHIDAGDYSPEGTPRGHLHITEASTLEGIPHGAYDAILCSHVIEHVANPLAALDAWRAVGAPGAHLLLVAPHKAGTFDHRRPTTTIEHMVADREAGVGEDDLTHLDEVLGLHDRARDLPMSDEDFAAGRRDNARTRLMHHHVFTTETVVALLDRAGLAILDVAVRRPHDVFVLARWTEAPDNTAMLGPDAPWRRQSMFRADRR